MVATMRCGKRCNGPHARGLRAMDTTSFGGLLRRYRVAVGLTQEELAERAALSLRGLAYLEQGERRPFRDTVRRLADALALDRQQRAAFEAAARAGAGGSSAEGATSHNRAC